MLDLMKAVSVSHRVDKESRLEDAKTLQLFRNPPYSHLSVSVCESCVTCRVLHEKITAKINIVKHVITSSFSGAVSGSQFC
jgi:hypothetical protein